MATSSDQHYCLRWNNHRLNLLTVFDELLQNEAFTDVTLGVEDGMFVKCHKMVLAACSSYFQSLFIDLPCKHPIVVLKDVKYTEIKAILEYMYRGEVNVAQDQLSALLKVAEVLKVKGLVEENGSSSSSSQTRRREETRASSLSPPPAISTSTTSSAAHSSEGGCGTGSGGPGPHSSPPHSTSSPYYVYGKSPAAAAAAVSHGQGTRLSLPMWALSHGLSLGAQNPGVANAVHQPSLPGRHTNLLGSPYDNASEVAPPANRKNKISNSGLLQNRDTPLLRNALGQGHPDSSQALPLIHPDGLDSRFRTHSNGSANNETDDRRNSMDLSHGHSAHSPYATDASMMDEDEKKPSPQSLSDDAKAVQKPEWKRYKQYTRKEIMSAIEAVRGGMSALQAARKYNVPSRTLYDKVKKLGITTSRPFRRSANGSGACFPYGIGGNANGSIYGTMSESENENSGVLIENPTTVLETAFAFTKIREVSADREAMMDIGRRTPSPEHPLHSQQSLQPPSLQHQQQQQQHQQPQQQQQQHQSPYQDNENQVEDLSVSRKSDVRVIMPPSDVIKEEIHESEENFNRN